MPILQKTILNEYNYYRKSIIYALLRYSYNKPAKLDYQSAEDVFQESFFILNNIYNEKSLIFANNNVKASFIWRLNKFTYLTMISSDKSKYKRGIPFADYIEDLSGIQVQNILSQEDIEYSEDPEIKYGVLRGVLLKKIQKKTHRDMYKMYLTGSSMKDIAIKYNLNVSGVGTQINRISKKLEQITGFKISKKVRKNL